ncbi:hypothetical protein [Sphaerospermopsis sp. FACHB-1194]|nr:hypothetical protein [Sphaerospermopsis sp. FACHB-1194]
MGVRSRFGDVGGAIAFRDVEKCDRCFGFGGCVSEAYRRYRV